MPIKLPFAATAIVWACRSLGLPEKAVWFQHWALDRCICRGEPFCVCTHRGDRCYAGAAGIADRLGISPRTVEDHRSSLVRLELLVSFARTDGARNRGYVAVMPIELPTGLTMGSAPQLRDVLDRYWVERAAGPRRLDAPVKPRTQDPPIDVPATPQRIRESA